MVYAVKLKIFIPFPHTVSNFRGAQKHVLIQRMQLVEWKRVFFRIEVIEIADKIPESITKLGVGLSDALHQFLRDSYVFLEINGSDPHTYDFSAEAVGDLYRINSIAQ